MHSPLPPRNADDPPPSPFETLVDIGNMLKAFIGINFMYVAYAFSKAGLYRGILGLVVILCLTEHCCLLLLRVKNAMPSQSPESTYAPLPQTDDAEGGPPLPPPKPPQYGDIAHFVAGRPAETLVNCALVLTQFGYCVGYLIFLSSTLHHMLPLPLQASLAVRWLVLLPLPVLVCVSMLVSIRSLGPFSIVANAALLVGFVSVVVFIAHHYQWRPSHPPLADFPIFFGQMTAAVEGIGLVVPVETSMRNKRKFPLVLRVSLAILGMVLMVVGVLGFVTFGDATSSIILRNFGHSSTVVVVKVVLIVGILFTYPLQIVPIIQFAESALISDDEACADGTELETYDSDSNDEESASDAPTPDKLFIRDRRRAALRVGIIAATAAVAMVAGKSFGLVQSLVGSLGASCLAYTAPAFFHYVTFRDECGWATKVKDVAIIAFGVVGAIVGTATTLLAFSSGEGEGV